MFSNLKNIFKVEDLRKKVFFTLLMIMVYRFGSSLRVPGIDASAVAQLREASKSQGALGFLNLFSGGAFGSFSIFALGIMPYITASIIMQVLNVVIPKLQEFFVEFLFLTYQLLPCQTQRCRKQFYLGAIGSLEIRFP